MRLVADANALLSAVLGGRARLIVECPQVSELLTVERVAVELQEYATFLARKKGLAEDVVLLAVGTLPVTVVGQADYRRAISEASRRIGKRDPDDIDLLALAIAFSLPIWSNDRDFEHTGVELFTTEALLRKLGLIAAI